ncbi:MAG: lysoplasmalogenase [Bacteroidetes bacterium]|nr:MAG: lysoplasmalogenase [Bacteroidota bacterium]
MKKTTPFVLTLFFLSAAINLWAEYVGSRTGVLFSKPLLMLTLGIYFWLKTRKKATRFSLFILCGLFFSLLGDSFLMFQNQGGHFFLLGLGSFLITHLFYIFAFWKYPSKPKGLVEKQPLWAVPVLFFLVWNSWFLWEGLPASLKIPVLVYGSVISGMVLCAINLKGKIPLPAFRNILIGALLFVISDAIIGITKFGGGALADSRLLIMPTYILGQFLIVKGAVRANAHHPT